MQSLLLDAFHVDLKHLALLFVELSGIHIKGDVKAVDAGQSLPFRTAG